MRPPGDGVELVWAAGLLIADRHPSGSGPMPPWWPRAPGRRRSAEPAVAALPPPPSAPQAQPCWPWPGGLLPPVGVLVIAGMTTTPAPPPAWRPTDLEAIRIALLIPAITPAVRAINDAMRQLEQGYPDAIPTARQALDAISAIDTELAGLGPDQLQAPIETRRKATAADALPADGSLPVKKADVIEFDTELLREETITRYGSSLSIEQALRRQRGSHAQALLLMLPALAGWSRDPQLNSSGGGFTAALERG